jgi:tRNA(fMet)-specific endonuclease VapC
MRAVIYLLDTHIVSAWARRNNATLMSKMLAVAPADLAISVLVEHELRYGFARNPAVKRWPLIEQLLALIPSLPLTRTIANRAAELRRDLAAAGTPIGPYDLLIAATALEHNATLVTNNVREFARVPALVVEDWLAQEQPPSNA